MPISKTVNQDFFKTWSPEMAYVLGFFAADGSMYRTRRGGYYIDFESTDREMILDIRRAFRSDLKISRRKRKAPWRTAYRLQIGNKTVFNDLLRLGLTPRKSKTLVMPSVPKSYLRDFVRGYFDGDGNVTVSHYMRAKRKNPNSTTILSGFISGSKKFVETLHDKLRKFAGIVGGTLYEHDRGHRLYFSVRDSLALYRFMYSGRDRLYLTRKRYKFEKYFEIA